MRAILNNGNNLPEYVAFERQRRGMSIAQGVSPGRNKKKVMNPLSLWERVGVREAL